MMVEDSTAPKGQILTQAFCSLKDPADLRGAAEGTVCKRSSLDTTVAQACRWSNAQYPVVTADSVLSRFVCSHLRD